MADSSRRRHLQATDAEIKLFTTQLNKVIRRGVGRISEGLKGGKVKSQQAAALLSTLDDELREAGLDKQLRGGIRNIYAKDLAFIRDEYEALGAKDILTRADRDLVETLVTFKVDDIAAQVGGKVGELKEDVLFKVLTGEDPEPRGTWDELGDKLERNVETELGTSVAAFNRTVTISKGKELGFELYEYLGPDDGVTRPFCQGVLNDRNPAIYTIQEIEAMDNGQDLPVITYGGGYNCRHTWRPISKEDAEAEGYVDSGEE